MANEGSESPVYDKSELSSWCELFRRIFGVYFQAINHLQELLFEIVVFVRLSGLFNDIFFLLKI